MRRAAAIALAVLLVASAAVASAAPTRRAVLFARSVRPFQVSGAHFRPGERVRVTVTPTGGARIVRHVTASRRGRFVLVYRSVHVCAGVSGRAVGSGGSRAAFSLSAIMC
jgi:hypothetical protein